MSQNDYNQTREEAMSGEALRAAFNLADQALASNNIGAAAPATTYPGMWWPDTTSGWMKQRNAANSAWVNIFLLAVGPAQLDSNGNLAVTATANSAGSHKMFKSCTGTAAVIENGHATTPNGSDITFSGCVPNNTTQYFLRGNDTSTSRFFIYSNGNMQNANNSYGAISDVKLKQDIVDADSQWNDVKAFRFRKYHLKSDPAGPLLLGVIAQELEQVSPGLIDETPDFQERIIVGDDGEEYVERIELGTTTKSVKYSVLYLKAVKALQEAMARIEALEARVGV